MLARRNGICVRQRNWMATAGHHVVLRGHPRLRRKISVAQFAQLQHAMVSLHGADFVSPVDKRTGANLHCYSTAHGHKMALAQPGSGHRLSLAGWGLALLAYGAR